MTRFIGIVSGKGGAGKTSIALSLGAALSAFGQNILLIDGNINNPNISIHLGTPNLPYTLHHALTNQKNIRDVAYEHLSGLKIIPSSLRFDQDVNLESFSDYLLDLEGTASIVFIDCASGLGSDVKNLIKAVDEIILIINPDLMSISDALKTARFAKDNGIKITGAIVNKLIDDEFDIAYENMKSLLEIPIIGVVPHDQSVREALYLKHPVVYSHPEANASIELKRIAANLIGQDYDTNLAKPSQLSARNKKGFFESLFG